MVAIQSSVIGREVRVDLFFESLNLLINLGTRRSSAHHRFVVANMETASARSIPQLSVASRPRRSFGATQV